MDKGSVVIVELANIAIMVVWGALAIFFGRWWIALFAIFCFSNYKAGSMDTENDVQKDERNGEQENGEQRNH